jgi:hypothetical protein
MVDSGISDKDGVSALGVFAEFTNSIYETGNNLTSHLNSLNLKYGFFASSNSYFICKDPMIISKIFQQIRYPKTIAGYEITTIRDLTMGFEYDSTTSDLKPTLPISNSNMITFK